MRRLPFSFTIIFVCIALMGGSSCALYEDFEPLGAKPDDADIRSDADVADAAGEDADAGADAELDVDAQPDADADTDAQSDADAGEEPLFEIVVSDASLMLEVLQTHQLSAVLNDADGQAVSGAEFVWRSDDETIATVDATGLVEAVALGRTAIEVSAEGVSATVDVVVSMPVERVEIDPSSLALDVTQGAQLSATVYGANDFVLVDSEVVWSTSAPTIVSVDDTGRVEGLREGSATVRAVSGGKQADVSVEVSAPVTTLQLSPRPASVGVSENLQLSATLRDAAGNELSGRAISWSSADQSIATVDADGLVFGVVGGTVRITASSEGVSDSIDVLVANPVATVLVSPDPASVEVLGTVQLSAIVRDAGGNELSGRVVTWRSLDSSIASVDSFGVVTGREGGIVQITATVEGVTASAQVTVENVVISVDITPDTPTLEVTDTMQLTALAKNIRGNVIPNRTATWTSSDPTVAQVSSSGVISAMKGGTATITAQIDNITGTAEVTVDAPVHSVQVTPSSASIEVTQTLDLSATLKDKGGNTISSGSPIVWSSENNSIATVSASGRVTAVSKGVVNIVASVGGIQGSAAITVVTLPRSITVSPSTVVFNIGDSRELIADVRDANNQPITNVTVQWSTNAGATVNVTSSAPLTADLTALRSGNAIVVAVVNSGGGATIQTTVSVTSKAVVESVSVNPDYVSLFPGDQAQLEAKAYDFNSEIISGAAISWSSSDPQVATVSAAGLVSAVAVGRSEIIATSNGKVDSTIVDVVKWTDISAGQHYSCGVVSNGDAYCWGQNTTDGVLGNGTKDSGPDENNLVGDANAVTPVRVSGPRGRFKSISTGSFHTCGLSETGKAYCWGANGAGHLGTGGGSGSPTPLPVNGAYEFTAIRLGANHTCALDTENNLYCWGYNGDGQLGQGAGSASSYSAPRRISGHQFTDFAVGSLHTCAIAVTGSTYCWGKGNLGQVGDGNTTGSQSPVLVDTAEEFVALSAGNNFTCGINASGEVYCWGDNHRAMLGDATTTNRLSPVRADPGYTYTTVFAGGVAACGRDTNEDVYCWGFNGQGNLGNGTVNGSEPSRVLVSGGYKWMDFSLGLQHTCGLTAAGDPAYCWGDNDFGQVGDGAPQEYLSIPKAVTNP